MKASLRVALTLAAGFPLAAHAQTDGPEFPVNAYTTSWQWWPSVALQPQGSMAATWLSYGQDGDAVGVFGRRFVAPFSVPGPEFRVNGYTTDWQDYGAVAAARDGTFVVVWTSEGQDGDRGSIMARRFDAAGSPAGPDRQVNVYTTGDQSGSTVAAAADGTYLVVWHGPGGQDNETDGIVARRLDAAGVPLGAEARLNTYTTDAQVLPSVAYRPGGGWIVVWNSFEQDGSDFGVYGRRLDASGAPTGAEFRLNTYTTRSQELGIVATGALDGSFVVTWFSGDPADGDGAILARLFGADGTPRGSEFVVNAFTTYMQFRSSVAMDATGAFVVAWSTYERPFPSEDKDVMARRFETDGSPRGGDFRVNSYTTGRQTRPAVAGDAVGNFVVAWESDGQDGDRNGVFAQRFGWLAPAALEADIAASGSSDGNGIIEPGEQAGVLPSWSNFGRDFRSPLGSIRRFTGPAPGVYEVIQPDADYGRIDPGQTVRCQSCPVLRVSGPRPAAHWDAIAEERHLESMGQRKPWRLHLGDSFSDVPRASGFYRFVETVLHRGVTAGCGASTYCPAGTTAREQMAAMVLVAREGPGYRPQPCGATPMFADVPASSPFCPFVEELARRGVAAGCGPGAFCPFAATTREQMPVFVLRTLDPALQPPACGTPMFADVPASSPFCRWIEELARRGVVTGCGGGNYCPQAAVTREQMAVFLTGTFGLALYGP